MIKIGCKSVDIMKIDIVTWVKDGAWVLPRTLKRLEKVLPSECVHRKIMIDDNSNDDTRKIGKEFNWDVFSNPNSGISAAANFALSKVDCPHFMSLEQDLFLSENWWDKISAKFDDSKVVVASGVRFADSPQHLRKLQLYPILRYSNTNSEGTKVDAFRTGKTLDNTLYHTKTMNELGGFPYLSSSTGVDTVLSYKILSAGLKWKVDYSVRSIHLRSGIKRELNHQRWYGYGFNEIKSRIKTETGLQLNETSTGFFSKLVTSPIRGLQVALKMREPRITYLYPMMRFSCCLGFLNGRYLSNESNTCRLA